MRIGIISDTHGCFDDKLREFLAPCDEIWHAGDFGNITTADAIASFRPLRAVYGNIDDYLVRKVYKEFAMFETEGVRVLMTHIGGYPGRYEPIVKGTILRFKPTVVICGHSHILKVIYDKKLDHLHINPGAAGCYGFHKVRTAIRLTIENGNLSDMEVAEWKRELRQEGD